MTSPLSNQTSSVKPLFEYLKKQQENRKFLKTVEFTATLILITFFLFFAVRPTLLTISALKGDIESKKILKASLKTKINDVIEAQDKFSQVQEKYLIVNASLPDRPKYYDAANQLLLSGQQVNVPVDKMNFNVEAKLDDKQDPNLKAFEVSVDMTGPFISNLKLASDLLKNRRLVNIGSINFENQAVAKESSDSATSGVSTRFVSQFYFWPLNTNEKK